MQVVYQYHMHFSMTATDGVAKDRDLPVGAISAIQMKSGRGNKTVTRAFGDATCIRHLQTKSVAIPVGRILSSIA